LDVLIKIATLSAGGMLGVNARYWQGVWMLGWVSPRFPWATFSINVIGSFTIGFLSLILVRWLPHENAWRFAVVGFLGGYTTFSSFALDALLLFDNGRPAAALAYVLGTVLTGLAAVAAGLSLARIALKAWGVV
jgi:CrcB protein